jgi:hypothetical protein
MTCGGKIGCICVSCPKKKIQLKIVELEFSSDHAMLKDNNVDWKNTGSLYTKPDWTAVKSNPISHSMKKKISAKLAVEVIPPDASNEKGRLVGKIPKTKGIIFDLGKIEFDPSKVNGRNEFTIVSKKNLRPRIRKLNLNLEWIASTERSFRKFKHIGTTQNNLYITMDKPKDEGKPEDGVTLKRMKKAVELVSSVKPNKGEIKPHSVVKHLMSKFPYYELESDPSIPYAYNHPRYLDDMDMGVYPQRDLGGAWLMAENISATGECQAICRFVRGVLNQIGCPGTVEIVVIWSDPIVHSGNTVLEDQWGIGGLGSHPGKIVVGRRWYATLADSLVKEGKFIAKRVGRNNFEACLKFTHGGKTLYYGGGAGAYKKREDVIHAFYALIWVSERTHPSGEVRWFCEKVVKKY